ncbi:glutamate receptor ionotropic, kainate glr-3-like [Haliotis asinina]|uniref:glutamate receptor ionotropic, kainate glr-3-like n=1 Tax=Haliotis asinina TaxID=109174 RepID=UPI003531D61C
MMSGTCILQMLMFMVYQCSYVWTLSLDILLNIKTYEKCPHPVVCHGNDSVSNHLKLAIWLVSAEEQFAAWRTVRSLHRNMMGQATLSSCQRQVSPSDTDDLNVSRCASLCPMFLSNNAIYIKPIFNVPITKQSYFDALFRPDSMGDVMRGITSIVNHVKWKTFVVITSSYRVLTAQSGGRLASIKSMMYMIDDPNNPLESIDLDSIYQLLPQEDLNFLVMCPSNCIQRLLTQARWLEAKIPVTRSIASQWLMVPSIGSVTDIALSRQCVKTDNVVFMEFMTCSRYFSPLIVTINESSIQAKLQVLRPSHTGKVVATVGNIGINHSLEVKHQLYHGGEYGFQNRTLIVGSLQWAPFVIKRVENGSVKFDGLCIQLLQELAKQLNFSYTLVEPEDREWSRILNGSWTGLVKLLLNREVDMVVAPMAMTESRATAIDFTVPYFYAYSALILGKQDPNSNKWLTLMSLFRYEVLICIVASLIFSTVFLFALEQVTPVRSSIDDGPTDVLTRYGRVLCTHFGALVGNGGAYIPSSGSGRTVLACWWLFAVILASVYKGNLIAFLTDRREKPPFSNLHEMVQQDTYKWGFVGGTLLVPLFQESNISVYHKVWHGIEKMMANDPDWLSLDGDKHMRRVGESQYVYLAEESTLEMWDDPRRCDLQMLRDNFYFSKHAVGLPKNSTYTQLFSKEILRIYESGILRLWWDQWKPKHQCPAPNRKAKRVDMLTLQSAFFGAGVGVAMAVLILFCEIIHKRRQKRKYESTEED